MIDWFESFVIAALIGGIGALVGYGEAHGTIARECERLGGFYVGSKTYVCEVKK